MKVGHVRSQPILPVEHIVGLGVQQDVEIHAPADHLGRRLHQAAAHMKEKRI